MDIYKRLLADHARLRSLVERVPQLAAKPAEASSLLLYLQDEIEAHQAAEEQTLYAEIVARSKDAARVSRGVEEHDAIVHLAARLTESDPTLDGWAADFSVFAECLTLHLSDEEAEVFCFARSLIDDERARALAERFESLRAVEMELWGKALPTVPAVSCAEPTAVRWQRRFGAALTDRKLPSLRREVTVDSR